LRSKQRIILMAVASLVCALALSACRPPSVRLAFAPRPGAAYHFAVHIESTSTTKLSGQAPHTRTDDVQLEAVDTVLVTTVSGSQLRVEVTKRGAAVASYIVRLDRQASLVGIDTVNGESATQLTSDLGGIQLQDLLPAALGAPPNQSLQSGDRWQTEEPFAVANLAPTRLLEHGRLDRFGVLRGRRVAVTTTTGTLDLTPVERTAAGAQVGLRGREHTTTSVTRDVADGSIEQSSAHTSGVFDIVLVSTIGPTGAPLVTGQLTLDVRSTTSRLD
jgi:hypothetical protein